MPKIPVYDRQFDRQSVDLGAPKQSFDTNLAMFGGGDAAGLKSLGGGMANVGTVMLATANRMKKEEDETAVLDAYRRYHDAVVMQLYGDGSPETGLFNRSGQGAIGATKEAKEAFDRARREIAGTLKNPDQQRAFGLKADLLASESMLSVARHEGRQRKAALVEGYKAVAKKENSYALLNFTDPDLVNAALGRLDEAARAAARLSGLDPEATESMVSALKSSTLKDVAMRHIENGNFTTVQGMLKDERLTGDDAAAVEKSFKAASDRAKSYGLFQEAMGHEDPLGWLREQDIDPLIKDAAEQRTKSEIQWQRSEQKEAEAQKAKVSEDALVRALEVKDLDAVQRIIEDAPAGLRKEFSAYRDTILSGKSVEDDPVEKWKWTQMLANDPTKFREEWNSPAVLAKLSQATREKFDNAYISLGKGASSPVIDEIRSDSDIINEAAGLLKIRTTPSQMRDSDREKLAALNRRYTTLVQMEMANKGRKLTTAEKQKIVDDEILYKGKVKGSGNWWSSDWEKKSKFEAMYEGKDFYIDVEADPVGYARKQAQIQGVPEYLVEGVIRTESNLKIDAKSPKGAYGYMQLMPGTARDLGVDPRDPEQNVAGGVRYLKQLIDRFTKVDPANAEKLALMAYNWGPNATAQWYESGADPSKVPAETIAYVKKVLSYKR
jgi:hypothetical protein